MNEFARDRSAPEAGIAHAAGGTRPVAHPVARPAAHSVDRHDALEWRERDRERARLLLERAGDLARRMESACGRLTEGPLSLGLPAGGHGSP